MIKIGTSKYKFISEKEIEMFCSSFWDIEYDINILHSDLEKKGRDPSEITKIIIHIKELEVNKK